MKYTSDIELLKYACRYAGSNKQLAKLLFNDDSLLYAQRIADWKKHKRMPHRYKIRFAKILRDTELLAQLLNEA